MCGIGLGLFVSYFASSAPGFDYNPIYSSPLESLYPFRMLIFCGNQLAEDVKNPIQTKHSETCT
jgi:hypothetical protein